LEIHPKKCVLVVTSLVLVATIQLIQNATLATLDSTYTRPLVEILVLPQPIRLISRTNVNVVSLRAKSVEEKGEFSVNRVF
jgi:hypothetical protein